MAGSPVEQLWGWKLALFQCTPETGTNTAAATSPVLYKWYPPRCQRHSKCMLMIGNYFCWPFRHIVVFNFDLPHWKISQPMCPQYLDRSPTSKPPETLQNSFHAPHFLLCSSCFLHQASVHVSALCFLERWMHFSGVAGARGSVSLQDWLHRQDHCTKEQIKDDIDLSRNWTKMCFCGRDNASWRLVSLWRDILFLF